jgi:hypothetical protein
MVKFPFLSVAVPLDFKPLSITETPASGPDASFTVPFIVCALSPLSKHKLRNRSDINEKNLFMFIRLYSFLIS